MVNTTRVFRVFASVDRDAIIEDLHESGPAEAYQFIGDLLLYFGDQDLLDEVRVLVNAIELVDPEPEEEEEESDDPAGPDED